MDLQKLKLEISTDPLGRGYSGMEPAAIAASLNTVNRAKQYPVPITEMLIWAALHRAIPRFKLLAASGPPYDGFGEVALALFTLGIPIGLDNPEVAQMLGVLVAIGTFTQEEMDDLAARSQFPVSRAEELGLPELTGQNVIDASYA